MPYFEHLGGHRYRAESTAIGPWSPQHLHAGPVAALMGQAIQDESPQGLVQSFSLDLWRPVPLAELRVEVEPLRQGKQLSRYAARLSAGQDQLAISHAVITMRDPRVSACTEEPLPFAAPEECDALELPFHAGDVGFHRSVELRQVSGGFGTGSACVWIRAEHPLLHNALTSLQRALLVADTGNGVTGIPQWKTHTFANADLSLRLLREPQGVWIGVEASSHVREGGVGATQTRLWDRHGLFGHVLQGLVVRQRS